MTSLQPPAQLSLAETVEATTELFLATFTRWALQTAASPGCSSEIALTLLDRAWIAQKLLWRLRESRLGALSVDCDQDRETQRHKAAEGIVIDCVATPVLAALPQPLPAPDRSQPVCS
ncbi:MAG TPA: hypothetical protein V6D06_14490 [Trichocoleus sp.]